MSFLKIGGKTASNTAAAMKVASDGAVVIEKKWGNASSTLYENNAVSLGTGMVSMNTLDISDCGAVSLRVRNTTASGLTINFYKEGSNVYLRNAAGALVNVHLGAVNGWTMITPNDVDALQWLRELRLSFNMDEAVSSGTLIIEAVVKR